MNELILILEKSVEKNGADFQLTLGHLLNIVRMANESERRRIYEHDRFLDQLSADMAFE